jgi:hypothetical protein
VQDNNVLFVHINEDLVHHTFCLVYIVAGNVYVKHFDSSHEHYRRNLRMKPALQKTLLEIGSWVFSLKYPGGGDHRFALYIDNAVSNSYLSGDQGLNECGIWTWIVAAVLAANGSFPRGPIVGVNPLSVRYALGALYAIRHLKYTSVDLVQIGFLHDATRVQGGCRRAPRMFARRRRARRRTTTRTP